MTMQRDCDSCGVAYEARHPSSRFHNAACRKRNARATSSIVPARPAATPAAPVDAPPGVLTAVLAELTAAGRVDTSHGQTALALARRLDSNLDMGSAQAALAKQLAATLEAATAGVTVVATPLDRARDQLAARRARRGA